MNSLFFRFLHFFKIMNNRLVDFLKEKLRVKMGTRLTKNDSDSNISTQLSETEINLLLESTQMTRQQIQDFYANFLKDCPNGILTRKKFCLMFKELHSDNSKTQKVEKFSEYVFKYLHFNKFFNKFLIIFFISKCI